MGGDSLSLENTFRGDGILTNMTTMIFLALLRYTLVKTHQTVLLTFMHLALLYLAEVTGIQKCIQ